MPRFKADLHTHTVLSPCGDVDMAPRIIVATALSRGLDIIAVTDHNSTLQCESVRAAAAGTSLTVLCGAEVTSAEEVHCLAIVPWGAPREALQEYLSAHLADIQNDPDLFGYQLAVDEDEHVIAEEPRLLISAISQNIEQIEQKVHALGGIFIPAHIDRPMNGLLSHLGFLPPGLRVDALELSPRVSVDGFRAARPELAGQRFVTFSDAHHPDAIARRHTVFDLPEASFEALRMALSNK
ncbi:MAG: PHP domain-containing protein [Rikenellaceae bacterium]|jgi:PHP family Zn ribbon phosphoesterase|nr:PHP domain-containing protein [Rikenellaceae bacterium]